MSVTDSTSSADKAKDFVKRNKPLVIGVALVAVVLLGFLVRYVVREGVYSEGIKKQNEVTAVWENAENKLSSCIDTINGSLDVANVNADYIAEILRETSAARYETDSSAQVGDGALFSAIREAYPDLSGVTGGFQSVMNNLLGCREGFTNELSHVEDVVLVFNNWREGSWKVRTFGGDSFPTDGLETTATDDNGNIVTVTGVEALEHIQALVDNPAASGAFDSGEFELDINGDSETSESTTTTVG